jgi:CHASE2 domain-containing sensor protein
MSTRRELALTSAELQMDKKKRELLRRLGSFVLACLIVFLFDLYADHTLQSKPDETEAEAESLLATPLFESSGIYLSLVTSGPRKPVQKFTVLVDTLDREDKYYASLTSYTYNPCDRRPALAKLLRKIAEAYPAVIVLDYSFRRQECPSDKRTDALLEAVAEISLTTPMVIGLRVDRSSRQLESALSFGQHPSPLLREGLIEFDPDTKKLPLKWKVRENSSSASNAWRTVDTLSLAVARAFDPDLERRYERLSGFLGEKEEDAVHPYVSFLRPEQMPLTPAGALVCGPNYQTVTVGSASTCEKFPKALAGLRGKIVVVGASDADDRHRSAIGKVHGFILQANYIEALLDQRYFTPAHILVNDLFGFCIFVAFMAATHFARPAWTLACWGITIVAAGLTVYFLIIYFGYFTTPVGVSVLALLFNIGHLTVSLTGRLPGAHPTHAA